MSDFGGHGGSSQNEIVTPLVIVNSKNISTNSIGAIQQVDFAPLLASLSGVSIPYSSIGKIPSLASLLFENSRTFLTALYLNALQMQHHDTNGDEEMELFKRINSSYYDLYDTCYERSATTNINMCNASEKRMIRNFEQYLDRKQEILLRQSHQYDMLLLAMSVFICCLVSISHFFVLFANLYRSFMYSFGYNCLTCIFHHTLADMNPLRKHLF